MPPSLSFPSIGLSSFEGEKRGLNMSFEEIRGQDQVIRLLQNALKNGRVAHAYCFAGPEGAGKKKAAIEWAKALNCENPASAPCDRCRSCRRISNGNHPDITILAPEGASIKIEQVRELQRRFSFTPPEEVTRVVILHQAETLTLQAANSLLKFLEEPVARMVAVLITEQVHSLLPTILSRCQLLRFRPLPPVLIESSLVEAGVDPANARIAAHLVSGVEAAEKLAGDDKFAPVCERMIKWMGEIPSGKSNPLVEIQTVWLADFDPGEMNLLLDLSLLWLRDLLNERLGVTGDSVFVGWKESRRHQASRWTISGLLNGMEAVIQARQALAGPVQPQAVLERMVLAMQGGPKHVVSRRSPFQTSG
ncbi:DNA polymerase III subunit delta' [Kroppenstedtia eburnea]|uniref:DNA polymerase-3 subunit delta n=2 Tax=Kroppenstedtia eburnea TaxID=714067 RepID=A0A1N7MSE5_9BACL|nr:DNA polymerase-3 subunit delta' [Kroppenstedtia eburnea]